LDRTDETLVRRRCAAQMSVISRHNWRQCRRVGYPGPRTRPGRARRP
jgi:hypothetical protein